MTPPGPRAPTLSGLIAENRRLLRCIQRAAACLHPEVGSDHERLAWWRLWDALNGQEPRDELQKEDER